MKQNIEAAIESHQAWTETFLNAIESRNLTEAIANSGYDDMCSFGKWLYNLDDETKRRPAFRRVKDQHYRFHLEAAEIVRLMEQARFADAKAKLSGDYAATSARLVGLLREWQAAEGVGPTLA